MGPVVKKVCSLEWNLRKGKRGASPWAEMPMEFGYDGRRLGATGRLLPKQERVASSLASWANRRTSSFGVHGAAVGDGWESGDGVRGATWGVRERTTSEKAPPACDRAKRPGRGGLARTGCSRGHQARCFDGTDCSKLVSAKVSPSAMGCTGANWEHCVQGSSHNGDHGGRDVDTATR